MRELKRAVFNRYMLLAVAAATYVLCRSYVDQNTGWKTGDLFYNIATPMALSGFTPFACIFPMLPYSLRFAEEYNSGYAKYALVRETRTAYVRSKLLCTAVSGGIMMAASFFITFAVAVVISTPTVDFSNLNIGKMWYPLLPVCGGLPALVLKTVLAFFFGCVWSLVSLLIAIVTLNRYVAFIATFILYQTLWHLLASSLWNPVYLLRADRWDYHWTSSNPFVYQGIVIVLLAAAAGYLMERKLRNV